MFPRISSNKFRRFKIIMRISGFILLVYISLLVIQPVIKPVYSLFGSKPGCSKNTCINSQSGDHHSSSDPCRHKKCNPLTGCPLCNGFVIESSPHKLTLCSQAINEDDPVADSIISGYTLDLFHPPEFPLVFMSC
jgi:hypothetical protein